MLKETRSPSEKKICCCKTWTRVLWISSPVRYPLSQYDLFLEMKQFYLQIIYFSITMFEKVDDFDDSSDDDYEPSLDITLR